MNWLYRGVRPLLFSLPPETAHHIALGVLRASTPFRPLIKKWHTVSDPSLAVTLGSGRDALTFPNPIGLAAGFDKDARALPALESLGFGFMETGTLTPRPQPGNPRPRLFRFPNSQALINRLGFNNDGVAAAAERLSAGGKPGVPLGINIGKNKDTPNERALDDYEAGLTALFDWADFFVVNVSSPNTPGLRQLQSAEHLEPLLAALRRRAESLTAERGKTKRPLLFVKVSPDEEPGEAMVETVVRAGFDGIVATNTTKSRAGVPPSAPVDGGLSGAPLRARSTETLRRLAAASKGRLALIGVGGVFSVEDALEKLNAGASLVEIYTGFVYGGPDTVRRLNRGLLERWKRGKTPSQGLPDSVPFLRRP